MSDIRLFADVDLQAAGDSGKGKRPTFSVVGYTGGVIRAAGWSGRLVVDLAGMSLPASLPILRDHDTQKIIGQGTPTISGSDVLIEGTVTGDDEHARAVVGHALNGFRWQASIGASVEKTEFVRAGDSVEVNGRKVSGPVHVARQSTLKETSFVALGADSNTSATVAATREKDSSVNTTQAERPIELVRAEIASKYIAERPLQRDEIDRIEAQAEIEGWDANRLELELIRGTRPKTGGMSGRNLIASPQNNNRQVLECGLMLRAGLSDLATTTYGEQACHAAEAARISSLEDLCRASLQIDRGAYAPSGLGRDEVIRAAFSTSSLPNILNNVVGRSLAAEYSEAVTDILAVATVRSAADFKPQKDVRPSAVETLEPLARAGEIQHTVLGEEATYNWSVDTFARMIAIDRKDIVNDDLGFVETVPRLLAAAAARSVLDLFFKTLLGGENAGFFHAGNHNNLMTTGSALAIGTLAQGVQAFREQRDYQGNNIGLSPFALIVPAPLEATARVLLNSAEVVGPADAMTPNGNPIHGVVKRLIVAPQLNNSDKFSGTSATAWYLMGAPSSGAILLGFLGGKRAPTVEVDQAPFNTLGIQLRVYHDFGCALGDPKAALKATGAAGGG